MKRSTILLIIAILFLLTGCEQRTHEYTTVEGIVTNLEYEEDKFLPIPYYNSITKMTNIRQQYFPEHNYVTITYGDLSKTFDDKNLYNEVEIGDTVEITLHQVYDKNHSLIEEELELND